MATLATKTKIQPKAPPAFQDRPSNPGLPYELPVPQNTAPEAEALKIAGLLHVEDNALIPARRLIVVVPDGDLEEAQIARQIWDLAAPAGLAVLFLGLCGGSAREPFMHRRLTILANLARDPRVPMEVQLEFGAGWFKKLGAIIRPGDVVVCAAEQRVGLWRRPLSKMLAKLDVSVWMLEGSHPAMKAPPSTRIREAIFWAVSLVIVMAFFWLQVSIARLARDWANNALMYFSILVEVGLLWVWHSVSS